MSGKCRGTLNLVLVVIGLAVPCFIAGVRDETVGTDVLTYAKWMFLGAQSIGFAEFIQAETGIAAAGRNIFTWLSVRLTGTLAGYLFCIAALCIVPLSMGVRRAHCGLEWIGILLRLLLERASRPNGMRQDVAMDFVFYASNYLLEKNPVRSISWLIVAILFRKTAVIALFLYPIAHIGAIDSGFRRFFERAPPLALGGIISVCVARSHFLGSRIVVSLSVLKVSYRYQVEHLGRNDFSIGGGYLSISTTFIWLIAKDDFLQGKTNRRGVLLNSEFSTVCLLASVGCLAWQLNLVSPTLGRIGKYGSILFPCLGGDIRSQRTSFSRSNYASFDALASILCCYEDRPRSSTWLALHLADPRDRLIWARPRSTSRVWSGTGLGRACRAASVAAS